MQLLVSLGKKGQTIILSTYKTYQAFAVRQALKQKQKEVELIWLPILEDSAYVMGSDCGAMT